MRKGSATVKNFCLSALLVFLAVFLGKCAGQIPPGGGPTDSTPPEIVRTAPPANAVNVKTTSITLEFSEYVERRTLEESVFISPYVGELEFDWSGVEVTIRFTETLSENRTYVVNIGTDVVDRRARNRMASGFTLAFSTGDSIDTGIISGRVYDAKAEGVMIFAYLLDGLDADTLDPGQTRPDFIMQTGKGGTFTLSNLPDGTFRLFAIRDEYRDFLYRKQVDAYGVLPGDVILHPDNRIVEHMWFHLAREDTTRPFITSITTQDISRINVRFSEPLDSVSASNARVTITDTSGGEAVAIQVVFQDRNAPSVLGIVTSLPLDSGVAYRILVGGVVDTAGNMFDTSNGTDVFFVTGSVDTLSPLITVQGLRDSTTGVSPVKPIAMYFSEPVVRGRAERGIALLDSADRHAPIRFEWLSPTGYAIHPDRPLADETWHTLRVTLDSLSDIHGNRITDSTLVIRFQTFGARLAGAVEGTVFDERINGMGVIHVTAASVDRSPALSQSLTLKGQGRFQFEGLPEGKYLLSAFRDTDSSGRYSFGLPFPFQPSERFIYLEDTLKVRARWSVEGVLLRFR